MSRLKELQPIRRYFRPLQPTVEAANEKVIYREVTPDHEIQDFVYCFWQLAAVEPLPEPYTYRVVSDGCIDIFFDSNQPSDNFVMGFCRKYTEFPIGKSFNYIGIRFLPAAFPLLFNFGAKALSNESQNLHTVLPHFSNWLLQEIKAGMSFSSVTDCLNKELTAIAGKRILRPDPRFFNALTIILQKNGFLDIEKELNTGLSPRQLRRVFNFYIGTTAKTFSNVVRFQYILNANPSRQTLRAEKLYLDVGFFDQAHFIRNFKQFYGVTPSHAFR